MLAQRVMQQSLRRATASSARGLVPRLAVPAATIAPLSQTQVRTTASQPIKQSEGYDILVKQRLNRPVAPHLGIYRPQIQWYSSVFHRITGSVLSGTFYIFGFGYLVAPAFGWHLDTHAIAAWAGSLSTFSNLAIKFPFAWFFTYHCFAGLRHLVWDTGAGLKIKQFIVSGWTVTALSVASALALLAI